MITELPAAYDYDEDLNSARCHTFTCYPGTIDGAERAYIGGGHGFAGPGSDGSAGGSVQDVAYVFDVWQCSLRV